MLKNKINALLLASIMTIFAACSDEDPKPEPPVVNPNPPVDTIVPPPVDTIIPPPIDPIYPVDFKFLTLNGSGRNGEVPSVSYFKQDTIILDYFKEANGEHIGNKPLRTTQIEDKLYIVQSWNNSNVEIVDPNSFKRLRKVGFNDLMAYDLEYLGGDSAVVIGQEEDNKKMNFTVCNLKTDEFVQRSFNTGFSLSRALRIGNKLLVGGTQLSTYPVKDSKLAIFDIDNMSNNNMRIISEKMNLFNSNSDFIVDKNGKVWFVANNDYNLICFCIDPETETIIQEIPLPVTMSTMKDLSYTLDNTGSTLYIRSHKAFYSMNVDAPGELDEPDYEYMEKTNVNLIDLKMTKEGTLLVIDQIQSTQFKGSKVLEFKTSTTGDWKIIKEYELPKTSAISIYVAKYEK